VLVLGRRAVTDLATALIFAAALLIVVRVKRVPEPVLLLAAGVLGVVVHGAR
jgi:chromate transporter